MSGIVDDWRSFGTINAELHQRPRRTIHRTVYYARLKAALVEALESACCWQFWYDEYAVHRIDRLSLRKTLTNASSVMLWLSQTEGNCPTDSNLPRQLQFPDDERTMNQFGEHKWYPVERRRLL